ncbi:MAG: LexA repressor [Candidatus Woesebacteria bacterium GW2011_GWA1_33_30]|uniref:LexA repressor n=1 Tax=Candidatus Woesebacteria bacterium GW2011_GWA2_33_28 TaxID=1618561 RepID=A0A0G0A6Y3_9BACT|nr:MAG: LexA repressor [Candidatus Woesebacteria bacterium GW2011_GWA2_33_28]KKP47863.1 MAG: LexA repressor [Candidatus Woesebacteria bacterium GW2011_GWA1_33_30]KKP49306.1 MAG: LexA repressor [Microgenomates group bacterium GW2011_GWC1_33_32]KKP52016.1 MAG: LexA repressor [Candidatus Woesebacteria bacterium GW2011_GWB1_33_38]KKP57940.1 MAG: LexA repressor [Microgenomates group bacterium GW2011_GWD1_33_9]
MAVSRTAPVIYKRQAQILDFIKQSIENTGFAPTLRDIANAIGVNSLATVHEHIQGLVEKGLLKRTSGRLRKMELTTDININNEGITVPILGYIAAGSPIEPMIDPNAHMSIPPNFASKTKRVYVLQVRGQSMIEDHIDDGDFVICEQTETATNGEIVVALLKNGMATLKRYFKEATRIRLEPANATMSPIFAKEVVIQGRVVGLIRKYKSF